MRQTPNGPNDPRRDALPPGISIRRSRGRWLPCLAMLAALAWPASLWAQEEPAPAADSSQAAPAVATPLAKYFPRDGLIMYADFSGLDAHADAWTKTAAYKILTETPTGEMLEAVGSQLLDKGLSFLPGHKLSGADLMALMEHAVKHGFAMGIVRDPSAAPGSPGFASGTIVIRGAAGKEARGLWSRAMGALMTGGKPQLDSRKGRTLVVVPQLRPGGAEVKEQGKCWWAEKEDLVLSWSPPVGPPTASCSAARQPGFQPPSIIPSSRRCSRAGNFEPVGIAFVDFEHVPQAQDPSSQMLRSAFESGGVKRVGLRFGLDDDALMYEVQLVAPKPRKPILSVFDQASFDASSLIPLPEGVGSFLEVSMDPNAFLDWLGQMGPGGALKTTVDEFADAIRTSAKIDFRKDFLDQVGPRMVLFGASARILRPRSGPAPSAWTCSRAPTPRRS